MEAAIVYDSYKAIITGWQVVLIKRMKKTYPQYVTIHVQEVTIKIRMSVP